MSLVAVSAAEAAAGGGRFDAVIDVRSPAEFAEDHLPGALNWPVLDDEQRRIVGTLYKHESPLQARNIADQLDRRQAARMAAAGVLLARRAALRFAGLVPRPDRLSHGAVAGRLQGFSHAGAHRHAGVAAALLLPGALRAHRQRQARLLHALAAQGAQTLDLEGLAGHRGSVLGAVPGCAQPSQKRFDTLVWQALWRFDPERPVFVEGESRKIGGLRVPEALIEQLREQGHCVRVELDQAARLQLLQEYGHFVGDAEAFCKLLEGLVALRGRDTVATWQEMACSGQWAAVFSELMQRHYDPLYERSFRSSYRQLPQAELVALPDGDAGTLQAAARRLVD